MDAQHIKTGNKIKTAKVDIKDAVENLNLINNETCTEETMYLIDEALECLSMAQRFLERIDLTQYERGYVSEEIIITSKSKYKK